jgi:TRAP-type C4-dicarboxylate transport system permease large subunit
MVFGLAIGLATPPVGSCLYVGAAIAGIGVEKFTKDLIPFIIAMILVLILIAFIPPLVTFVPEVMLRK